jgi:hypothetical protein
MGSCQPALFRRRQFDAAVIVTCYCVVMGQKVPIERPRVRTTDDKEVRLGSYEMFQRGEPLTETVWAKLMLGLSTREWRAANGSDG